MNDFLQRKPYLQQLRNNDIVTSYRHFCQVWVVHIIVENFLSYMSANFYHT